MDNAVNTGAWQQANTFMDIISPRVNNSTKKATPAKSRTLMRSAVKKPTPQTTAIDLGSINKARDDQIAPQRTDLAESAMLTDKSPLISRFSPDSEFTSAQEQVPVTPEVAPLEVRQYPSMEETVKDTSYDEPVETYDSTYDFEGMETAIEQPSINIFKNGLPSSFEFAKPALSGPKKWSNIKKVSGWSILAIAAIGVIGGGLFINSNVSKLELYMASSRAGFAATLPSQRPSGYGLSSISTGGGVIEASYKSNTSNMAYSISEKKSAQSSNQLFNSYVQNEAGQNYQAISSSGRTIFIYNSHDATWVSNGIWYVVQDNNSLSNHQIVDIANSM